MKLEHGDSPYGRFVSPSGVEMRAFSSDTPLPEESEVKVHFHGSLSSVVDVFSTFDDQKKEILRSMKFHGILNLRKFDNLDLYFCLWIMTKVDCSRCSIRLKGCQEIPIRNDDVGNILGIPWYGLEMLVETEATHETVSKIMNLLRMADMKANFSVSYFKEILKKDYGGRMNKAQTDAFKIAVVVFTMSNVLATGGNPKSIPLGLLKYLTEPDEIHNFNWGLLVRRYMVSWCHLVQQQIRMKQQTILIGGCFLLPMITYLDNIHISSTTMVHCEFPRTAAYNCQIINTMIAADTTQSSSQDGRVFGKSEGNSEEGNKRKQTTSMKEESRNKKHKKGMVAKLVLQATNKPSRREIMKTTGLCNKGDPNNTTIKTDESADNLIGRMDTFIEQTRAADSTGSSKCSEFFKEMQGGIVLHNEKYWFHHFIPYPIKIKGSSLAAEVLEGGRYSTAIFDAITRDQVQTEDVLFSGKNIRERHLMAASFIEKYRNRDENLGLEELRIFFQGDHVKYNVTECIQINMTVSCRRKWSCYSCNLKNRTLTVLDPYLMKGPVSIIKRLHEDLVTEMKSALFSCLKAFFPTYSIDSNEWTTIYRNDISEKCIWSDTGVYSMHYALRFNSDSLTDEINSEDDFIGRWKALWRILAMDGNVGDKPERFKEMMNGE